MPGILVDEDDVCFYITEKCNSNCIMCPMSLDSRKRGESMDDILWEQFEEHMPCEVPHITITGGEPFLFYHKLIPALEKLNRIYPETEILILTNGRVLSIPEIMDCLKPYITRHYRFAIPIHGPNKYIHDAITASSGSFLQTISALHSLCETEATIEVRIVGHQLNLQHINATYHMLSNLDARIDVINLVAMEMTGCAARNRQQLWVDYLDLCEKSEEGIRDCILHGIDAGLYNFPLCQVPQRMWSLVKHSITPSKVRFAPECENCSQKDACGGLFYSTYELGLCKIKPFKEDK